MALWRMTDEAERKRTFKSKKGLPIKNSPAASVERPLQIAIGLRQPLT
jgi:hypothetical protein